MAPVSCSSRICGYLSRPRYYPTGPVALTPQSTLQQGFSDRGEPMRGPPPIGQSPPGSGCDLAGRATDRMRYACNRAPRWASRPSSRDSAGELRPACACLPLRTHPASAAPQGVELRGIARVLGWVGPFAKPHRPQRTGTRRTKGHLVRRAVAAPLAGVPPHPSLWLVCQRQPGRQHRSPSRALERSTSPRGRGRSKLR